MDIVMGSGGNSGDQQEASNAARKGNKACHRHTVHQSQTLEAFFKECPHPDENQRLKLGKELGLDSKQIKFWFQNKRTQIKAQAERADNLALRAENERIICENNAIKEALKNVICPACGGLPYGEEERQHSLQKLQLENANLKEEHEKVSKFLTKFVGRPISQVDLSAPFPASSMDLLTSTTRPGAGNIPLDNVASPGIPDITTLPYQFNGVTDTEKSRMLETAAHAMDELISLLKIDEPLWVKSPIDGKYIIDHDSYEKIFHRGTHFESSSIRIESSKDSGLVSMRAMQLVDMFLDSDKWVDLFPAIVTKAKTIQVLEPGMIGNKNGSLQLMYEQMHILSPLVPPREFYFLRYCQQIQAGLWVVMDVSCDFLKEVSHAWKLPSGCMIQEMPTGCSEVTWVEHVEVEDKSQIHHLYRDLIGGSAAYGSERWVISLQRMCERVAFSVEESVSRHDFGGVIKLPEGRRNIMKLAHRMVKSFCSILSMSGNLDISQLSEVNQSGLRVSVRKSTEPGQPSGVIVSAASSLWLPLPCESIFNLFKDEKKRVQWDVLSSRNPVTEIAHISTGINSGNCISIIQPFVPTENGMVILQECCTDSLGSLVIYAPMDKPAMNLATRGEDSSNIPILPSGFIISRNGCRETGGSHNASTSANVPQSGGSLLTVVFQILVSSSSLSKEVSVKSVAGVNSLISSTVQKIKVALRCPNLD
ncbi:hypothetical protein SLE2022_274010 [Rubroshorea leprosula]